MKKTMQKLLAVFLAAVLMCGTLPFAGVAAADIYSGTISGINWMLNKRVGLLSFTGSGTLSAFTPGVIVGQGASYSDMDSVRVIEITEGITKLGTFSFSHYHNLQDVYLPASLTDLSGRNIGFANDPTFHVDEGSAYLTKDAYGVLFSIDGTTLIRAPQKIEPDYVIPDTVRTIDENAFAMCTTLESIVIPDNVQTISKGAFYLCTNVQSITLGSGVQTIGAKAFSGSHVSTVRIPAAVQSLDHTSFEATIALTAFEVDAQNGNYASPDGVLTDKNVTTILAYPSANARTAYAVPDTVQTVEARAFSNAWYLTSVTIPSSVRTLGEGAFAYAKKLTNVTIANGLQSIGSNCFINAPLEKITLPNSIKTIEWSAFSGTALDSIVIPGSVDDLSHLFSGCKNLHAVILRSGVLTVDLTAFANLKALETVHIPSTVTSIGSRAFENTTAVICSDSADCEASRYAAEHEIGFSVCEHEPTCGAHAYVQTNVKEADCTNAGYTEYICSVCGHVKKLTIEPTGHSFSSWTASGDQHRGVCDNCKKTFRYAHNYTSTVTKAATCTEAGTRTFTCGECGASYDETIPALGHALSVTVVEPTCYEQGVVTTRCSRCAYVEREFTPKFEHEWEETARTDPTCTEPGTAWYRCRLCADSKTEELDPLGHDCPAFLTEWTETTHTMYCTRCGETISGRHDLKITHEIAATCTRDGEKTYTCDVCGYVNSKPVPRLGHDFGDWQPMEDDNEYHCRICTRCGDEEDMPHQIQTEIIPASCLQSGQKISRCRPCGYTVTETIPPTGHDFIEDVTYPTCEEDGVRNRYCSDCGLREKEILPKTGHRWTVANSVPASCTQDGVTEYVCENNPRHKRSESIEATGHAYDVAFYTATCTEGAKIVYACRRCGDSFTEYDPEQPALGHDYDAWQLLENTEIRTCRRCGEEQTRPVSFADYTVRVIRMDTSGVYGAPEFYTHRGVVGRTVSVDAKEYLSAGWTLNEADSMLSGTLAESGTTLDVILDRVQITVSFLLPNGNGYTTYEQLGVLFGAQIVLPLTPQGDDWFFLGWFTADGKPFTGAAAGAEDLTVYGRIEIVDPTLAPTDEELDALYDAIGRLPDPENLYFYKDEAILRVAAALNSPLTDANAFIADACANGYALRGELTKVTVLAATQALRALLDAKNETGLRYSTGDGFVWRDESKAELDVRVVPIKVNGAPTDGSNAVAVNAGDRITFAVRMRTNFHLSAADIPIVFDATRFYLVDKNGRRFSYDSGRPSEVDKATSLIPGQMISTQDVAEEIDDSYTIECFTVDSPEGQYPEAYRIPGLMRQFKILHLQISPNVFGTVTQKLTEQNDLLCTFTLEARPDAAYNNSVSAVGAPQDWYKTSADFDTIFAVTRAAGMRTDGVTPALHGSSAGFAFEIFDSVAQYGQSVTTQSGEVRFAEQTLPPKPPVPTCEHDYEILEEKEPTVEEDGYRQERCTKCGDVRTEPVLYADPLLEVKPTKGTPGSITDVDIYLRNNPGIISTRLFIRYDPDVLTLERIENGEIFSRHEAVIEGGDRDQIPYILYMADELAREDYTQDGLLVKLIFSVNREAALGATSIELSIDSESTFNVPLQNKPIAVRSGNVMIQRMYGDVDLDAELTLKDVVLIRRFLVDGNKEDLFPVCMDFYKDGLINNKDSIYLARYIAGGWDIELPEDEAEDDGPIPCDPGPDSEDFGPDW